MKLHLPILNAGVQTGTHTFTKRRHSTNSKEGDVVEDRAYINRKTVNQDLVHTYLIEHVFKPSILSHIFAYILLCLFLYSELFSPLVSPCFYTLMIFFLYCLDLTSLIFSLTVFTSGFYHFVCLANCKAIPSNLASLSAV